MPARRCRSAVDEAADAPAIRPPVLEPQPQVAVQIPLAVVQIRRVVVAPGQLVVLIRALPEDGLGVVVAFRDRGRRNGGGDA